MLSLGKRNLLGVLIDAVDYEGAVDSIIAAAHRRQPYAVTALAVHGLMTGVQDPAQRHRLNQFDLVTPDGQPVRWALNLLYKSGLPDRVYGPTLTLDICEAAASEGLPVFLYGSRPEVLERMEANLKEWYPDLEIAGTAPSMFRQTTPDEKRSIAKMIKDSGAQITLVGLGCPRQEIFAYEYRDELEMPVIAVGAAFDYHAGLLKQPPDWVQRMGLQWLYRLLQNPRRLWNRYLILNPMFLGGLFLQATRLWRPDPEDTIAPSQDLLYG